MKKAGIITFSAADSFGALMQSYALRKKVTEAGYNTQIINYWPKYLRVDYRVMFNREELKAGIHSGLKCLWRSVIYIRFKNLPKALKKKQKMNQFRKKYLNVTRRCYTLKQLEKLPEKDIYIAGSDQVWNPELTGGALDPAFFLSFVPKGTVKVSYAASTGSIPKERYLPEYGELLKDLQRISVREEASAQVLQQITNKKVQVDKDPTLLMSKEEWEELLVEQSDEEYILFFSLYYSPEQFEFVNKLSEQLDCPVKHYFYGRLAKRLNNNGGTFYFDGPQEILTKIKNAKYVVSDSFHITVFSILFEKEFTTFPSGKWSERMKELLRSYDMLDRFEEGQ